MKLYQIICQAAVCLISLVCQNSSVEAGNCTVRNNSDYTIYVCTVETKTAAQTEGDLGSTFSSTFHVKGWVRIVSGGEYDFSNISHVLAWAKLPSGKTKVWRYSDASYGGKKYYTGFLVDTGDNFYGQQYQAPRSTAEGIRRLSGDWPKGAKGRIRYGSSGWTSWGEFGTGVPSQKYLWGFRRVTQPVVEFR